MLLYEGGILKSYQHMTKYPPTLEKEREEEEEDRDSWSNFWGKCWSENFSAPPYINH